MPIFSGKSSGAWQASRSAPPRCGGSGRQVLPKGGRHWGLARKVLNIFLRDCCYNRFLCRAYSLQRVERWLEVPLDSHVGTRLREEFGEAVPRWKTIKALTQDDSATYQEAARTLARRKGILPVHLDLYMWRSSG